MSILEFDHDRYPTEASLAKLKECLEVATAACDICEVGRLVREALETTSRCIGWDQAGWETVEVRGEQCRRFAFHTFGWSGAEDVIGVLLGSWIVSGILLDRRDRCGHFYFDLNPWGAGE